MQFTNSNANAFRATTPLKINKQETDKKNTLKRRRPKKW